MNRNSESAVLKFLALLSMAVLVAASVSMARITPASALGNNGKVIVIMIENSTYDQMRSQMPYLTGLSGRYTYFDNYFALTHPSEPNYLTIAGGSTFGDTSDHSPAYQVPGKSVFGQAFSAASGSWRGSAATYAEDMPGNCWQSNAGTTGGNQAAYAPKHNPWVSFTDERAQCNLADVPMGTPSSGNLRNSAVSGHLPNVGMMIPNQCNDGHGDCTLGQADRWLQGWMPVLMNGPDFVAGRLTIVVTADEDDYGGNNRVLTTVIAKATAGKGVNHTYLNHYSLCGFLSDATGSPHLRNAATAPNMRAALALRAPK